MNVLVDGVTPQVIGAAARRCKQWLDHRRDVLMRRSRHRLAAIERRLELLAGMIIVFLNLDEVIRIVREDDEPKEALKARFTLNEIQADYVLDTRLRALRRLEEMALRKEQEELKAREGHDRVATRQREEAMAGVNSCIPAHFAGGPSAIVRLSHWGGSGRITPALQCSVFQGRGVTRSSSTSCPPTES